MKKILVVFTGGTIGSNNNHGLINVNPSTNHKLISLYKVNNDSDVEFQTADLMQVLSENITAKHWEILCNYLFSLSLDEFDGIIITHGSDTLAFSSALVGMMFAHTKIPICFIASNKPLEDPDSNGIPNFAKAVDHIINCNVKGIFTIYDDIYPATRIMPADSCLDKFTCYGKIDIKSFFRKSRELHADKLPINRIDFKNEILMIYAYPNINYSAYIPTKNTVAVLYVPYHSGTACTEGNNADKSFIAFIERCKEHNVPVYLSGIKSLDNKYTTLDQAITAGAIPLMNISEVAAYAKLMIAYNQSAVSASELLGKNIYFEIVE